MIGVKNSAPGGTAGLAGRLFVAAAIAALALLSYFEFPGHTWLQADTQVYVPILERLWDPNVLAGDPMAERPHVAFTIYDEVTLGLRRITHLDLHVILTAQQLVFRALGIFGVYLLATALGLSRPPALIVAAAFSLGATVVGPSVLTLEYEPIPRGFAGPLIFLALGLVAHGRDLGAGCAGALAFLYHPPTAAAFWAVYFILALWPTRPAIMSRHIAGLAPLAAGAVILLLMSRWQAGVSEPQILFSRLDAELEKLQRLRAPYNWVGSWEGAWIRQHIFAWLVSVAAFLRLRRLGAFQREAAEPRNRTLAWPVLDLEFFLLGLPLAGILSMPLSYLLLDQMKWALAAQLQPARNLLFVVALAGILGCAAAAAGARRGRWWEAFLWLLVVYAIPAHTRLLQLGGVDLSQPLSRRRVLLVAGLSGLTAAAMWMAARRRVLGGVLSGLAMLAPFAAIPGYGKVRNYPDLHSPELRELASWARMNTAREAVFLFPDAGRELFPGIFRAQALRPVYVDWKSGGQVNFLKGFAAVWWDRWQHTMAPGFRAAKLPEYAGRGVDYIVLRRPRAVPGRTPVFQNRRFAVYRLRPPPEPPRASRSGVQL